MGNVSRTLMGAVFGAVLLSSAANAQGAPAKFPDVPQTHWAFDAVQDLAQRGVLEGYPDGTFGGGRAVTRYEMTLGLQRFLQDTRKVIAEFEKTGIKAPRPPAGPPGVQGKPGNPGPRGEAGPMGAAGVPPEGWAELLSEQIKLRESLLGTQGSFTALRDELRALRVRLGEIQLNLEPAGTRLRKTEKKAPRAPLGL